MFTIEAGQFGGRRRRLSLSNVYSPKVHRERDKWFKTLEESGKRLSRGEEQSALHRKPFIGAEAAGYLIYDSVIAAWLSSRLSA
jgi:hypothetical protein